MEKVYVENTKRIYMDNAATTPLNPQVLEAMMPYLTDRYGTPSSIYAEGRRAKSAIEAARRKVANAIGAKPYQIVFTSGATESNNTIMRMFNSDVMMSAIEHPSVYNHSRYTKNFTEILRPNKEGIIKGSNVMNAVQDRSALWLLAVMLVNNEVGSIQPIADIRSACEAEHFHPWIHVDAVQAIGHINISVKEMGIQSLSISAHKFGGPKGVGALYVQDPYYLGPHPLMRGGHQEALIRPGTENVAGIVGLGAAIDLATKNIAEREAVIGNLARRLWEGIAESIPDVKLNGPKLGPSRLAGNVNVWFMDCPSEKVVLALDDEGICCSGGSACSSGSPSHTIIAMYNDKKRANESIRFSLSENNTEEEVDRVLEILPSLIDSIRRNQ